MTSDRSSSLRLPAFLAGFLLSSLASASDPRVEAALDPTALDGSAVSYLADAAPPVPAAAGSYAFSQALGSYAPISGGTLHGSGATLDDNIYSAVEIGFPFRYDGVSYTQVGINANGFIRFGGTAFTGSCGYAPISSSDVANCRNLISALGMDLQGNAGAELRSQLTGSAPERIFTVQWSDMRNWNASGDSYDFQIRLHEADDGIEVVYGAFTKNATNRTPQVGIKGATNADFNNRATTTDWAASTPGASNSATMALTTTVLPSPGLGFTWTPPETGPTISYTPLANISSTANRSFTGVAIADPLGVDTAPGTRPRVYYKRASDSNYWNGNSPSLHGWKYVEANGTSSPFDFTIDYSLLYDGSGVIAGDVIEYFVVAQNLRVPPLVSIQSGEFDQPPASVALTVDAFPIGGTIHSYRIASPLSGSYAVPGDYPSLTNPGGIFEAINQNTLSGNVEIRISADLTAETGAVALSAPAPEPAGSNYSILIRPSGAARVISGTSANNAGLITLAGADRVTIDGSLGGGFDRSLTLHNLAPTGVVVRLRSTAEGDGATDNMIRNCVIEGQDGTSTLAGIMAGGSTTLGADAEAANSRNTIRNNVFRRLQNGAYLRGSSTDLDDGWLIENNQFGSPLAGETLGYRGVFIGNAHNFAIRRNFITGVVSSPTSSATTSGIHATLKLVNGEITANLISPVQQMNPTGWGSNGILLASSSTNAGITVANNFISDVASQGHSPGTGVSDNGYGIMVDTGGGYRIVFNSVLMNVDQANGGIPAAINIAGAVSGAGSVDLRNNIFATTQSGGTPYAIVSSAVASVFSAIDHNDYFAGPGAVLGRFMGSDRATLGNWQDATGQDDHSIAADPLFVSASNLHLAGAFSPAVNAGAPIAGLAVDIDGGVRSTTTPDIGADEWGAAGQTDRIFANGFDD